MLNSVHQSKQSRKLTIIVTVLIYCFMSFMIDMKSSKINSEKFKDMNKKKFNLYARVKEINYLKQGFDRRIRGG